MRCFKRPQVQGILATSEWTEAEVAAVEASLAGQVTSVHRLDGGGGTDRLAGRASVSPAGTVHWLVVSEPVLFARGAIRTLIGAASPQGRVLTRVLVPGAAPTAVSLWSQAWLADRGIDPAELAGCDLEFDRARLPHDDSQVRGWVRADDVGIAPMHPEGMNGAGWAWGAGLRLAGSRTVAMARSALGRIRRRRALAEQRRRAARRSHPVR